MSSRLIIVVMTFDHVYTYLLLSQFNKPTCVVETNATAARHLYALQNIIAAKKYLSRKQANKKVERGQRGEGVGGQPPLTKYYQ